MVNLTFNAVKLLQLTAQSHIEANARGTYSTLPCDPQVIEALCAEWLWQKTWNESLETAFKDD